MLGGFAAKAQILLTLDDLNIKGTLDKTEGLLQGFQTKTNAILAGITLGILTKQIMDFGSAALAAYQEAEQAEKGLAAVLKSTGQAAGFSKEQLTAYATELEDLTNVSDEAIIKVEQLLATFTNIKGDNFLAATKAVLDMGAVLGSTESAAIQVGKALNDPANGLSALSRSGVSFTEEQKIVIKHLAETGRMAEAQAMMLRELEVEFGGAADTAGTFQDEVEAAGVKIGRMQEDIGALIAAGLVPLVPHTDAAVASIAAMLAPALGSAMALAQLAAEMLGVADASGKIDSEQFVNTVNEWKIAVSSFFTDSLKEADNFSEFVGGFFDSLWSTLGAGMGNEADMKLLRERAEKVAQADIEAKAAAKKAEDEAKAEREKVAAQKKAEREKELEDIKKQAAEIAAAQEKAEADKKAAQDKERADKAAERKRKSEAEKVAREAERAEEKAAKDKARAEQEAADEAEKARLKAYEDYKRSLGRDSLSELNKRIQDSALILKQEEAQQEQATGPAKLTRRQQKERERLEKQSTAELLDWIKVDAEFGNQYGAGMGAPSSMGITPPKPAPSPEEAWANTYGPKKPNSRASSLTVVAPPVNVDQDKVVGAIEKLIDVTKENGNVRS